MVDADPRGDALDRDPALAADDLDGGVPATGTDDPRRAAQAQPARMLAVVEHVGAGRQLHRVVVPVTGSALSRGIAGTLASVDGPQGLAQRAASVVGNDIRGGVDLQIGRHQRRTLQAQGAEVIHLGHNRSVQEIVDCAIQEDAQGIAITSYQGGHVEYLKYMFDLVKESGLDIRIYGAERYLHSGHYGNWAPNPAQVAQPAQRLGPSLRFTRNTRCSAVATR